MLYELNERLMNNNYDPIHQMGELDEVLKEHTPTEIIMMATDKFSANHPYFEFDGYGHLISYSTVEEILELYNDIE